MSDFMGPWQENGLIVSTTVARDARLRSNRTIKVPFATLSTTMQVLHQRGVSILSVGSPNAMATTAAQTTTASDQAETINDERKSRNGRRRRK